MAADSNTPDDHIVALLTEHQIALRLYVQSLMPGDPNAHDVTQHANTTLWQKRADFEPGTNFKAWAFAIARYEVLNYRKKQARDARRLIFSDELENTIAEELPTHSENLDQRHDALKHCLTKLRPKDRELILHRYFKSASLKDYAEKVGRSVGGLKVTLHRLRAALQKCIEGQLETGKENA
ncbi:MAG: sigma-70 family RNA polymerase sigma factor [Verrucomicrobiota bacterium]